jgi:hypothetical protein
MKSQEHRAVGQAATAGTLVEVGDDPAEERFVLSYGDLVALSGDFFASHHWGPTAFNHQRTVRRTSTFPS